MTSLATPIGWRGLLAIVVGIIAIAWPGITVNTDLTRDVHQLTQEIHAIVSAQPTPRGAG